MELSSSTETSPEMGRAADELRSEVRSTLSTLREQLQREIQQSERVAESRHQALARRLEEGATQLARIVDAQDDLRRQTDGELRGARQAIVRLTGEIQLIEGRLRIEHGVSPVDLDTVPGEWGPLVAQVRAAEALRAEMLDGASRAQRETALAAYEEMRQLAAESRRRALEASRVLARGKARGRQFRRAAEVYRHHWGRLRLQQEALRTGAAAVAAAREDLRYDAQQQEEYRARKYADAVTDLTALIRRRVDIAVETHALFPAWFTVTELGHRPSPERTQRWRETAARVVLYRVVHDIKHGVLALGEEPEGGYRARRHAELREELRALAE